MKALRTCGHCGLEAQTPSELSMFKKDNRAPYGRATICRSCDTKRERSYCKQKKRDNAYKYRYNISLEDYNEKFNIQNGRCGICGRHQTEVKKRLAVDHDHVTGQVRSLLCDDCNKAIGCLQDSSEVVMKAFEYLWRYGK